MQIDVLETHSVQGLQYMRVEINGKHYTMHATHVKLLQQLQAEGLSDESIERVMECAEDYAHNYAEAVVIGL